MLKKKRKSPLPRKSHNYSDNFIKVPFFFAFLRAIFRIKKLPPIYKKLNIKAFKIKNFELNENP